MTAPKRIHGLPVPISAPQLPGMPESGPEAPRGAERRPPVRRPKWRPGDRVRTDASVKPKHYANRAGTVFEVRRTTPANAPARYEVGVRLNEKGEGATGRAVWFRSNELGVR